MAFLWLALSLLIAVTAALRTSIVLQFDGSLRPPRDIGFPSIPRKQAVCAACLYEQRGAEIIPLVVGSKILPTFYGMSSQHAEYKGLLLGLEHLKENQDLSAATADDIPLSLTIQGDCKTVMDQMTGKAVPRKLEALHNQAKSLVNAISNSNNMTIIIQHIPREENLVSDNLCCNLMNVVAYSHLKKVEEEVECCEATSSSLRDILAKYLHSSTCRIPYSRRPPFYDKLASMAQEADEYETLVAIGDQMLDEAKRFYPKGDASTALQRRGISHQIQGWRGLGKIQKAEALERKHRFLLSSGGPVEDPRDTLELHIAAHQQEWDPGIPACWSDILKQWFEAAGSESDSVEDGLWVQKKVFAL